MDVQVLYNQGTFRQEQYAIDRVEKSAKIF